MNVYKTFVMRFFLLSGALSWLAVVIAVTVTGLASPSSVPELGSLVLGFLIIAAIVMIPAGLWTWFTRERSAMKELHQLRAEVAALRGSASITPAPPRLGPSEPSATTPGGSSPSAPP